MHRGSTLPMTLQMIPWASSNFSRARRASGPCPLKTAGAPAVNPRRVFRHIRMDWAFLWVGQNEIWKLPLGETDITHPQSSFPDRSAFVMRSDIPHHPGGLDNDLPRPLVPDVKV